MKQRLFSVFVLVVVVAAFGFASNGDTINIGGHVPLQLTLTVTPNADTDNLPLDEGDIVDHEVIVAAIGITTNNTAGWDLVVFSTNAGNALLGGSSVLVNADDDTIAYSVHYTGAGGALTGAPITNSDALLIGEASNVDAPLNLADGGNLVITYDQSESYPAGYYSDQLAIVLRAK